MEGILIMEEIHNHLKPIIIQRKRFAPTEQTLYRVYSAPGEYQSVEANTANEAFEKSGIRRPHKIERETMHQQNTVKAGLLSHVSDEEEVSFDTHLPDPEDLKPVLYALLSEESSDHQAPAFESIFITDLKKARPVPLDVFVEPEPEIPVPEVMAALEQPLQPYIPAAPEDVSTEEEALTPEQVDALLNGA